ncbi:MAG TPA: peptide ABC transporter substrate-binding protein [Alphaproteobacteria bacterium]|nr:peptide ABC transporter substrate-binding protein [Alphaproteobacteria bacterium]
MFVTILGLALANMASAQQKILIRGNGAEPNSLDPHSATGTWENNIIGDLFMGLYTEDAAAKPILGAADSVKTAPDGLSWTFTIRPHTWSDGVPVTANDFVFAFQRILNPANAREYAQVLFPIKGARAVNTGKIPPAQLGVKAIDAKTLVIELEKPAPYLPELLTHYTTYPIPKHAYDKHGDKWSRAGNMVTNGPFMLKEWRQNDRVIAAKNPKFYDAANVKLDGVVYFPTQDDPAAFRRFQAGELDMHERWPIAELARIRANPTLKSEARSYTYLAVFYTVFNMTRKPFDDVRIRKALAMSIDRKTMLEKVFQGALGVPAVSFFPPGMANADMSHKVFFADMPFEQRRAEARKLMEAAGYGPNKRLKLTFNIGNTADAKRQAVFVQSMWQEIYVDAEIMSQDTAVHYKTLQTKNYDVGQAGWVWDYNDAKNILFLFESTTKAQNYPGYNNPEYDALMIASDNEKDPVKRGEILGKMNALLLRDLPATPNIHQFERKLVKSYVKGFVENARVINRARYLDLGPEAATISARAGSLK